MSDKLAATQHGMTQPLMIEVELQDDNLVITGIDQEIVSDAQLMTVIFDVTHAEVRITYVRNSVMTTAKFPIDRVQFYAAESGPGWGHDPGFIAY